MNTQIKASSTHLLGVTSLFTPITSSDLAFLQEHIGRETYHVCKNREFQRGYRKRKLCPDCQQLIKDNKQRLYCVNSYPRCGEIIPKLVRKENISSFEYIYLTYPERMSLIVTDIDIPGAEGGLVDNLAADVKTTLETAFLYGFYPNLLGINKVSGKAQLITYIDSAYTQAGKQLSRSMTFAHATAKALDGVWGGDKNFSHNFSRNPWCGEGGYAWYFATNHVRTLTELADAITAYTGEKIKQKKPKKMPEQFSSGTARIDAARKRVEERKKAREHARKMVTEEVKKIGAQAYQKMRDTEDPDVIQGVKIYWLEYPTTVARDKTAFQHALWLAWLRTHNGERYSARDTIEGYLRAYEVAANVDMSGRTLDAQKGRDLDSLAQRIKNYIEKGALPGDDDTDNPKNPVPTPPTTQGRKTLATLGRRGGKKAQQVRWDKNRDDQHQHRADALKNLDDANYARNVEAMGDYYEIGAYFLRERAKRGNFPTIAEAIKELNVSRKTISRALKVVGVTLPRGRRKSAEIK
ncbi:replication initiation protein [Actinotignum urinale]|uniref:replication initiation protein n=1 Tax=Actinotignum urinale TaxID=190146 RepID=UPI002A83EEE9|nr:replication initiation protein [Actinotignum urinale]MDY5129863.1 replication initiation protein [Actinotignum urinale]